VPSIRWLDRQFNVLWHWDLLDGGLVLYPVDTIFIDHTESDLQVSIDPRGEESEDRSQKQRQADLWCLMSDL
jgi:hypothetical protein